MNKDSRLHYIDNLRSLALLLGIVFHAALAYSPFFSNIWFTADPSTHRLFDYITHTLHLFRMPLFFIIAGFCSVLLIAKSSSQHFLCHRSKHILLPFIVFLPLGFAVYYHALSFGAGIAKPIPPIFAVFKVIKEPVLSTMHLWFLWNLFQFCLIHWLLKTSRFLGNKLDALSVHPLFMWIVLPIVLTLSLMGQSIPFPAPDKLTPQLWSYGFYGSLYWLGVGLYKKQPLIWSYHKYLWPISVGAALSLIAYFALLPAAPTLDEVIAAATTGHFAADQQHVLHVLTQVASIILLTAMVFLLGHRFLNHQSKLSRSISNASYWVYLIHVPVLIYIQMPLINTDLPVLVKFIISVFVTLLIGQISYLLLVKNTWLGALLNGRQTKKKVIQPA
ncbi:acyltransferase family protein [Pseudoalteromonas atlantica]|uniref:acyltransferase family protein n=1 Tax=Pseudoalteromonas atlantica TaxID=288 RepID=UPI003736648A